MAGRFHREGGLARVMGRAGEPQIYILVNYKSPSFHFKLIGSIVDFGTYCFAILSLATSCSSLTLILIVQTWNQYAVPMTMANIITTRR